MAFPISPESEKSEWLEADGLGGFASGTVSGIRTRRYHALLLAADLASRRSHGAGQRLRCGGRNRGGPIRADDATLLRRESILPTASRASKASTSEPWPQWTYAVPGRKDHSRTFCSA